MPKLNFPKTIAFSLGVLAMIFSLNYLILAWTEPSSTAPNDNVPAPINVGTSTQIKAGALGINGLFTAYSGISVNNKNITDLSAPVNGSDAVNKDYVDALSEGIPSDINMPLQGVLDYSPQQGYISTIPISLPKSNCGIKITVCNAGPTKMVIGADPVARITKSVINLGPQGVLSQEPSLTGSSIACGGVLSSDEFGYSICAAAYCPSGYNSCWLWRPNCSPATHRCCPNTSDYYCSNSLYCLSSTDPTYKLYDCVHNYLYKEPRCSAASIGQVYIQYSDPEFTCIYCPTDHPVYDPISKNCTKDYTVSTLLIGSSCSTLSTYLTTSFTDVTFKNDAGAYVLASYIKVGYNCPI